MKSLIFKNAKTGKPLEIPKWKPPKLPTLKCIGCKGYIKDKVLLIDSLDNYVFQGRCKNPNCRLYQIGVVYAEGVDF